MKKKNILGKEENVVYLPQCFQKVRQVRQKSSLYGKGLKNHEELSVVSCCILALSSVTTNHIMGTSLRWVTGSEDK